MDNLLLLAVPMFLVLLSAEAFITRGRGLYRLPDTLSSIVIGLSNLAIATASKGAVYAMFLAVHRYALFDIQLSPWTFPLIILLDDFTVYWHHRAHHMCRLLWATHAVHHSSRYMNFGTALRHSCFAPLTEPIFYLPIALLGVAPDAMLLAQALSLVYGFFVHTELIRKLGPLEWVFVTPSHHRVHHGTNARYLDRNFGGELIIWDRLFGTFQREQEPPAYGLRENIPSLNPIVITFAEWRRLFRDARKLRSWRDRLRLFAMPPAWLAERARFEPEPSLSPPVRDNERCMS